MNVIRCVNHHFFDSDKYPRCPRCGEVAEKPNNSVKTEKDEKSRKDPKSERKSARKLVSLSGKTEKDKEDDREEKNATRHIFDDIQPKASDTHEDRETDDERDDDRDTWNDAIKISTQYSDPDMGLTQTLCGNFSSADREESGTDSRYTMYTVGWLICIEGENAGCCYALHENINTVGRAKHMDVCIDKDTSVSRNIHFKVIYDARNKQFILQPSEDNKLIYCNGELTLGHRTLDAYDLILAGKTTLMFMPLCGTYFTWQEGKGIINYSAGYDDMQYSQSYEHDSTGSYRENETTVLTSMGADHFSCPVCGATNPISAFYCEQCGKVFRR